MVKIGFDDNEEDLQLNDEEYEKLSDEKKEQILDEIKKKEESIKIPQRRIDEMMAQYDCVVVQDFGDDYHLSEEEREKNNQFYKEFRLFANSKSKYRKLDKYVEVMRNVLKCLDAVAEKNGVYSPDKFKALFLKGKIKINGLFLPRYAGPNKKHIDSEFLADFILSDKDPSEILPKPKNELISEEDYQKGEAELFMGQDVEQFLHPEIEKYYVDPEFDETLDNPAEFAETLESKKIKKLIKATPELLYTLKEIKKDSRNIGNLNRYMYNFATDDIEYIEAYDKEHNYNDNGSEPPIFTGDIMNDDEYHKYLVLLDEWEQQNVFDDYKGSAKSLEKINTLQIQSMFEEGGFNIMKFYGQEEKEKRKAKLIRQDDKKAKKIKKKLINLERRNERRKISDNLKTEKRLKSKKKKDKGKEFKKQKKNEMDDVLLSAVDMRSFKEYKSDTLDWTFGGDN